MNSASLPRILVMVFGLVPALFMHCRPSGNPPAKNQVIQQTVLSQSDSVILLLKSMHSVPVRTLHLFNVVDSNEFRVNPEMDAYCDTTIQVSENIFYSIISIPDEMGVCSYYFLLSIDEKSKGKIASVYLRPDCDIDFSQETYEYYEHQVMAKDRILVKKITVYNKAGASSPNEEENIDRKETKDRQFTIFKTGAIQSTDYQ